jgi:hypothetical protein
MSVKLNYSGKKTNPTDTGADKPEECLLAFGFFFGRKVQRKALFGQND